MLTICQDVAQPVCDIQSSFPRFKRARHLVNWFWRPCVHSGPGCQSTSMLLLQTDFNATDTISQAASQGTLSQNATDAARTATSLRRHIYEFQACITALEKCEKPIIAILHGISYGLAIDLSLACDIRLCAADTRLTVKEVDIGLAADIGTLSRLPKAVGNYSWVKEVCLSARIFDSAEAEKVGLVSGVYNSKAETVAAGLKLATLIASKSPVAVQGTKEILNYSRDRSVEEGLRYTAVWNQAMLQTQDVKDAMLSGLQKKTPKFSKL